MARVSLSCLMLLVLLSSASLLLTAARPAPSNIGDRHLTAADESQQAPETNNMPSTANVSQQDSSPTQSNPPKQGSGELLYSNIQNAVAQLLGYSDRTVVTSQDTQRSRAASASLPAKPDTVATISTSAGTSSTSSSSSSPAQTEQTASPPATAVNVTGSSAATRGTVPTTPYDVGIRGRWTGQRIVRHDSVQKQQQVPLQQQQQAVNQDAAAQVSGPKSAVQQQSSPDANVGSEAIINASEVLVVGPRSSHAASDSTVQSAGSNVGVPQQAEFVGMLAHGGMHQGPEPLQSRRQTLSTVRQQVVARVVDSAAVSMYKKGRHGAVHSRPIGQKHGRSLHGQRSNTQRRVMQSNSLGHAHVRWWMVL